MKQLPQFIAAGILCCGSLSYAQDNSNLTDAHRLRRLEEAVRQLQEENRELRAYATKESSKTERQKSVLPDWVTSFKFTGDMRGRFEQNSAVNSAFVDRNRYRYRLRFGAAATMLDDFEVGFRLSSGDPFTGGLTGTTLFGGNPDSANTTLGNGASRKFLWVDKAYGKWTPIHNGDWTVSGTIGKMDNPFALSNMIFDYDIQPEGAALQTAYHLNDKHSLKFNGAFFVLNEIPGSSDDPYMAGAQLLWESEWTPALETAMGISAFNVAGKDQLLPSQAPNVEAGNTRDATGRLLSNFNPIVGSASLTYKFDSMPFYKNQFPVKVGGEFLKNPGARSNNEAWNAGVTFGKAGKKGNWEVFYRYQVLKANAWYEEFPDDDNGAFYAAGHPLLTGASNANGLQGAGFFGGTNIKGHYLKATYSFTDAATLSLSYYLNELIIDNALASATDKRDRAGHLIADLMWRF
ncbi:MAG: putative porin [Verrucomicrobia bacterium]|nr:putative porin [Verrucomicrobiota bacterium]